MHFFVKNCVFFLVLYCGIKKKYYICIVKQQERDNKMRNNEIIKRAQAECGEYVTGYKGDITIDSLNAICEAMWNRAINLTYCFTEWLGEVLDVIGKKNFEFWIEEIRNFQNKKMQANKYYMFHGERYCA